MNRAWLNPILASVLCGGCASAPVNYYTLEPPVSASKAIGGADCCRVEIRSVRIPVEVDRPELVVRRGGQQLTVLGNDEWAAPLRDEIRSGLKNEIDRKLAESGPAGPPSKKQKFLVLVDIRRFESEPARYALVQADWRVEQAGAPKVAAPTCETTARVEVESGVSALVRGHQQAITQIADQIASYVFDAEHAAGAERAADAGLPPRGCPQDVGPNP